MSKAYSRDQEYWDNRYRSGGDSGAGSKGRLADFKVETLNNIIRRESINSLLDFGSGDGQIARRLDVEKPWLTDSSRVSRKELRRQAFGRVVHPRIAPLLSVEMGISLDVTYHITDESLFTNYMTSLLKVSKRFVVIYSRIDELGPKIPRHIKSNDFVRFIEERSDWELTEKIDNPFKFEPEDRSHTSKSDFYVFSRK